MNGLEIHNNQTDIEKEKRKTDDNNNDKKKVLEYRTGKPK